VKTFLRFATVVACLASIALSAQAQGPRPSNSRAPQSNSGAGSIAVIDISRIFKEHKRFRAALEDMKKDVEAAESSLRKEGDDIKKLVEQMKAQYTPGSPQYKQQEELIATKQAQLQLRMNLQKKNFMEQEAKIYYNIYQEIEQEVKYFAQRHNINLVLRFNNIQMSPDNRQKVLAGVNRAVVYQNNIDITYDILQRLNGPERNARRQDGFLPPQ